MDDTELLEEMKAATGWETMLCAVRVDARVMCGNVASARVYLANCSLRSRGLTSAPAIDTSACATKEPTTRPTMP